MKRKPKVHRWDFYISVRKDGRVIVVATAPGLLIGHVQRMDTHDGPAWFWSLAGDEDDWTVGGLTRRDAVRGLLEALAEAGAR